MPEDKNWFQKAKEAAKNAKKKYLSPTSAAKKRGIMGGGKASDEANAELDKENSIASSE